VHGLDLLLAFGSGVFESLILVLNPLDFTFDLFFPIISQVDLTLLVVGLVLADFLKFCLLLDLEKGLLDGLGEQNVEDGLNFTVVIEEVVVLDLGDLVDSGFLGDVLGSFRTGGKHVRLRLAVVFVRLLATLLSQEVG